MQPIEFSSSRLWISTKKKQQKNDNEEQNIETFASSEMSTVYLDGLSNEEFLKMLSKMLNILFMVSS